MGFFEGSPALIVRPLVSKDVQEAVRFARSNGLVISVRSGGHSAMGFGTNVDGLVIDLSLMDQIAIIDEERHIVRLGSGATWGKVAKELAGRGLAISAGDTADVGVGGLLLGGGIGWKVRKYGLALDNLVAAEVVTADGKVLRASADDHADLFWALRGGGGNFGVVTAFEVAAHPTTAVYFGAISYPVEEAAAVLEGWAGVMATAPEELTAIARLVPGFGGPRPPVTIEVCFDGDDPEAYARAIEPLLKLGTVVSNEIKAIPYDEILVDLSAMAESGEGPGGGEGIPPDFEMVVRSAFTTVFDGDVVRALVEGADKMPMFIELRSLGGAMARVPVDGTAFAHRQHPALMVSALMGPKSVNDQLAPAIGEFWTSLAPYTAGAYVNFLGSAEEADVRTVYPDATYERLSSVKRVYDPENVFTRNHNVSPA